MLGVENRSSRGTQLSRRKATGAKGSVEVVVAKALEILGTLGRECDGSCLGSAGSWACNVLCGVTCCCRRQEPFITSSQISTTPLNRNHRPAGPQPQARLGTTYCTVCVPFPSQSLACLHRTWDSMQTRLSKGWSTLR